MKEKMPRLYTVCVVVTFVSGVLKGIFDSFDIFLFIVCFIY